MKETIQGNHHSIFRVIGSQLFEIYGLYCFAVGIEYFFSCKSTISIVSGAVDFCSFT